MKVRNGIAGKLTHCGGEIWVVSDYVGCAGAQPNPTASESDAARRLIHLLYN